MSGNVINRDLFEQRLEWRVVERLTDGVMSAGMNVIRLGGELSVHPTAEANFDESLILLGKKDGSDLTVDYASGDLAYATTVKVGDTVQVLLAAGVTTAIDSELASAGDGTFKLPAVAGAGVLYKASEVVTGGASPLLCDAVRIK